MANREHLKLLKSGAAAWNRSRSDASSAVPDLADALIEGIDLREVTLGGLNLRGTSFRDCILRDADLSGCYLVDAGFHFTDLSGANFSGSTMGETSFTDVDLSTTVGLDSVNHKSRSHLTVGSIQLSHGQIPDAFLHGSGVPLVLIEHAQQLRSELDRKRYYTCFVSYSRKDLPFAKRLQERLESRAIQCWRDDHEILPGEDIEIVVRRNIERCDRMLLCCSEHSMGSKWVEREIEAALQKQEMLVEQTGGSSPFLLPINLDSFIFTERCRNPYRERLSPRLIADFTNTDEDWRKFNTEVEKLIRAVEIITGVAYPTPDS